MFSPNKQPGAPVFAFASMILFIGLMNGFIMGPFKWASPETRFLWKWKFGARKCFIMGVVMMTIGGVLQGLACQYKLQEWSAVVDVERVWEF